MKISDLVVVTSNAGKIDEINAILGTNHKISNIDIPEIQSLNLDEVITEKAKAAYEKIKKPVLVTDVSLEIEGLNGLPGPFVKFFLKTLGEEKTVQLVKGSRKTKVTDAVAIYDGRTLKVFKGTVWGKVIPHARGNSGFGFDFVFIPKGYNKTYSQMPSSLKNKISHRALALKKLKKYLNA
ncbi:hypothetical protein A2870_00635 [Candidatus Curtissbacteria bacterium RIFCSPHIGHO2_01_FULL_41_11]|uniref:Non-canonical purine NTP pyrophosphatase, RdgB/HAM1 family n=1 Tax=Candidatus Curtissbacteria bacterium RIFCSPHIGHO2_01_FULL_41_11 TaxID=1797711 RepID=A0A1F5G3C6_9BACT|nr:MAG: hypothetical protein A2870_00635 [Candidatus Curtissbacteria bacterium RIFCSPHIGHO2_01_FULL_41_11]